MRLLLVDVAASAALCAAVVLWPAGSLAAAASHSLVLAWFLVYVAADVERLARARRDRRVVRAPGAPCYDEACSWGSAL